MAASAVARKRLKKEMRDLISDPAPHIRARPNEKNILEFHYVIEGPKDSPYAGGWYWGKYPFKPPSIFMMTPNGRFQTGMRLCLSMSDYHPNTWSPQWSVRSILIGLLSFMLENGSTAGSIETTVAQKRAYAARSLAFNVKHPLFCDLFPEAVDVYRKQYEAAVGGAGSSEGAAGGASGGSGTAAGDAGGAEGAQGGARRRGKPAVDAGGAVGATGTPPAGEPPKPGTTSAGVIVLAIGVGLLLVSVALHWWRKGASSEA